MRIETIKWTNPATGETGELTKKKFKAFVKKHPAVAHILRIENKTLQLKSFKFIAWVHPKKGGDDYRIEIDQVGDTLQAAKKNLEDYLSTISSVTDDYTEVQS